MRNLFLFLIFIFLFSGNLFSQSKVKEAEMVFAIRGGIHESHIPTYELGGFLFYAYGDGSFGPRAWFGTFFSFEKSFQNTDLNNGKPIQGWKAGGEYDMAAPWGFRCSFTGFKINNKQTLKLCPEAGLSIYPFHLFFGYNSQLQIAIFSGIMARKSLYFSGFQLQCTRLSLMKKLLRRRDMVVLKSGKSSCLGAFVAIKFLLKSLFHLILPTR